MQCNVFTNLVGVVRSGGCGLALVAGGELSEVTVVVTLPESRCISKIFSVSH